MDLPPLHPDRAESDTSPSLLHRSIHVAEPLSEIVAAVPAEILTCIVRYVCVCTHTHTRARTHTHTHAYMHTCMYVCGLVRT
jgi:hypothetical protein